MKGRDSWVGVSSLEPMICSKEAERHQKEAAQDPEGVDAAPKGLTQRLTLSQKSSRRSSTVLQAEA